MDRMVRIRHADALSTAGGSSHTVHSIHTHIPGEVSSGEPLQTRRQRLVAATPQALAEAGVDRLARTRDSRKTQ